MKVSKIILLTGALCGFSISASAAYADTQKDVETIAKAIGFINGGPTGTVTMDILYDPNNPNSVAHADEIADLTSGGVGSKVKLTGKKVSSPGNATSRIIFMTRGTNSMYEAALNKAAINGGLTVSTDETCLGSGCVMVVKTYPNVDILVSDAASDKTGTKFSAVFSMMITKK